ncbi:MAG: hypothetical protein HC902_04155 [Calothrix sp. SM1_5_4]|nr:hypothetical protein [Calothrix sp. SM1_5_4]
MLRFPAIFAFVAACAFTPAGQARELSVLFLGNSYTYLPDIGSPEDPGLPRLIKRVAESIEPGLRLRYDFNTPGGYTFEMHFKNADSIRLAGGTYDKVILQGRSNEALELTPWWESIGSPGIKSFSVYLPKLLDVVLRSNDDVTLFVNWNWHPSNVHLREDHVGLFFPEGHPRAGQKWCGRDSASPKPDQSELHPHHRRLSGETFFRGGRLALPANRGRRGPR